MILDESTNSGQAGTPGRQQGLVSVKVRIRYRKDGALRLIGHNDLMRCWNRLVRRTGLPIVYSQGHHPAPRLSCPLSLPLGVVGDEEIFELKLERELPAEEIHQRLAAKAVDGLTILSVSIHPAKSRTEVVAIEYVCPLPDPQTASAARQKAQKALASPSLVVSRATPKKRSRSVDLRPMIHAIDVADDRVRFRANVVNGSTARVEELLGLLELQHLLQQGVVVTRSRVQLADQSEASACLATTKRYDA